MLVQWMRDAESWLQKSEADHVKQHDRLQLSPLKEVPIDGYGIVQAGVTVGGGNRAGAVQSRSHCVWLTQADKQGRVYQRQLPLFNCTIYKDKRNIPVRLLFGLVVLSHLVRDLVQRVNWCLLSRCRVTCRQGFWTCVANKHLNNR